MNDEVKRAVIDFIAEHGAAPLPEDEADRLAVAYLDEGLLDSMAVVELVTTLEDRYDFRFDPEDMQSIEFRTIGGLVELVSRQRASAA